jgi:hypothetical protein
MYYTVECDLDQFEAWSGGKETLDVLIEKGVCDEVQSFIEETLCYDEILTETQINDFLWFERDQIAAYLGYEDWDAFENGENGEDEPEIYEDINGVELAVSDEVHWLDVAGYDEDGSMFTFTIVEERGDGYFNLAYGDEENPERWAYYTELEIV